MAHDITVGKFHLRTVAEVKINKSVETLSDTAVITLPGSRMNESIEVESKIKVGDAVVIRIGYGEKEDLSTEFTGYLNSVQTDDGSIKLECIDGLYHFKKSLENEEMKDVTLSQVLDTVLKQVNDQSGTTFEKDCKDFDVKYQKWVIYKATGYDVLKKIQEELKANIFFAENTLFVKAPYSVVTNDRPVIYDFSRNIEKSELKYVKSTDRNLEVEVTVKLPDGTERKETFGKPGGDKKDIITTGVDASTAKLIAKNEYDVWVYDGFEGHFTGWLIPFVEPAYKVELRDAGYPDKNGVYYVIATETTFSPSGGVRKITLGRRLE
jgi:hypothetical protein